MNNAAPLPSRLMNNAGPRFTRSEQRPGFGWLWKSLALLAFVALVITACAYWWQQQAEQRFHARLAALEAAGLPTTLRELQQQPVPDDENAATLWERIGASLGAHEQAGDPSVSAISELIEVGDWPQARAALDAHYQDELALAREAAQLERTDWGVRFTNPPINTLLPHLAPQRNVARLLASAGRIAARDGRLIEAIEIFHLADRHATHLSESPGMIIGNLVSVAIRALSLETLRETLLRIHTAEPRAPRDLAEIRARLTQLDRRLAELDDLLVAQSLDALHEETLFSSYTVADSSILDAAYVLHFFAQAKRAARAETYPAARAQFPRIPNEHLSGMQSWLHIASTILLPSLERAMYLAYQLRAEQRMARAAIAVAAYKLDHGQRPASLAALVPNYLNAIPADPLHPDADPLRYLPNPADGHPRLYSVGEDGVDDGGTYILDNNGTLQRDEPDLIWFLTPNPTAAPPTQPTE